MVPKVLGLMHHICVSFLVELGLIGFSCFLSKTLGTILFLGYKAEHVWLSNSTEIDLLCLKTSSEMEREGLGVGDSFAGFTSKIDIYNLIPFTEV